MTPAGGRRVALLALALGLPAVVLAGASWEAFDLDRHAIPKELALEVMAGVAGVALVATRGVRVPGRGDTPLLLWWLGGLASALLAASGWPTLRALGLASATLALFWVARALATDGIRRPVLSLVALAATLGAGTGLVQAYGLLDIGVAARAPGGTFGNRNFMAHATVLGLPALLFLVLRAERRGSVAVVTVATALCTIAVVLSRSRAAWLGLAATVTVAALALRRADNVDPGLRRRRVPLLAGALALGALVAVTVPNTLAWKSDSPYAESLRRVAEFREGSGRGRLIQYRNTLGMVAERPVFGVGPGNWPAAYARHTTPNDPAFSHVGLVPTNPWPSSDWVTLLAERGLLGLACAAAAFTLLARDGVRALRGPEPERGIAALALLAGLGVMGMFDAVLLQGVPAALVPLSLGVLVAGEGTPARGPHPGTGSPPPGRVARPVTLAAALLALAVVGRTAMDAVALARYDAAHALDARAAAARLAPGHFKLQMLVATEALRQRGCGAAHPWLERATRLQPGAPALVQARRACGLRPAR